MGHPGVPSTELPPEEKAKRSGSFGAVASLYERYRPGPPLAAVEWMLPPACRSVIDLGAGTGALTRLLVDRVDEVIAVEPDDRMRAVLGEQVPKARAVAGRGDSMPLPDGSVNAVLASSSWHWMDVVPTLREIARVLTPGGMLGAVWSGPDPDGAFLAQARAMFSPGGSASASSELASAVVGESDRPMPGLLIPDGEAFTPPEQETFRFDVALTADDIIGLLGTFSWIITMDDERRDRIVSEARRLMRELMGVEGDVTVDVTFRADAFRTRCTA